MNKHSNLLQRAKLICNSNGIMLHKYLFNEPYARKCKLRFKCNVTDGIADYNNNNNNIYLKSNIHSITRYKFSRLYKNMVSTIWLYNAY